MNLSSVDWPPLAVELILNIFGVITGAVLAYLFALRQFRIQKESDNRQIQINTALDFFEELTSDDFSRARSEANKIFKAHIHATSLDDFYYTEDIRQPIRKVLSFFRRLQLSIEYGRVDHEMAVDLFAGEFLQWYFMWLDKLVPPNWATRKNIDKLNQWYASKMDPVVYAEKKERAFQKKQNQLAKTQKKSMNKKTLTFMKFFRSFRL